MDPEHSADPPNRAGAALPRFTVPLLPRCRILPFNPATAVRGPKHMVKRGKTPVLTPDEARLLLDSIDMSSHAGLRDRALIGLMVYTMERAVLSH